MPDTQKATTRSPDAESAQVAVSLSGDIVAANLERLVDDGVITSADKALMLWFFAEVKNRSLSLSDAGKAIGYDASTISRVLRGRYEGNWGNILKSVRCYKHLVTERAKMVRGSVLLNQFN